jgi:hypothetical protein
MSAAHGAGSAAGPGGTVVMTRVPRPQR